MADLTANGAHWRLLEAPLGARLRDRLGVVWLRQRAGACVETDGSQSVHGRPALAALERRLGPFTRLDDPSVGRSPVYGLDTDVRLPSASGAASGRWEIEDTALHMAHVDRPTGDGWEPFAVESGRLWWRRRVPS